MFAINEYRFEIWQWKLNFKVRSLNVTEDKARCHVHSGLLLVKVSLRDTNFVFTFRHHCELYITVCVYVYVLSVCICTYVLYMCMCIYGELENGFYRLRLVANGPGRGRKGLGYISLSLSRSRRHFRTVDSILLDRFGHRTYVGIYK